MKLLFIDCETGGIDPNKHSILSIALVVWKNKKISASKEIFIGSDDFIYTKEALKINGIDILEHKKKSIPPKKAVNQILDFIKDNFEDNEKVRLAGHNVAFDISFIKQLFKNCNRSFNNIFSHRSIDTSSILTYLYISGLLEKEIDSSTKAFKYFNIDVTNRHTALGDAIATAELFNKMIELNNKITE